MFDYLPNSTRLLILINKSEEIYSKRWRVKKRKYENKFVKPDESVEIRILNPKVEVITIENKQEDDDEYQNHNVKQDNRNVYRLKQERKKLNRLQKINRKPIFISKRSYYKKKMSYVLML